MVSSAAGSVEDYLAELSPDRRRMVAAVREVVLEHLPPGYEEGMEFGMISWHVPLSRYPETYNGRPLARAALASQKRYVSLYLMGVYGEEGDAAAFRREYAATGRRLDMGKACVRFRTFDDLPLELIGRVIAGTSVEDLVAIYERSRRP